MLLLLPVRATRFRFSTARRSNEENADTATGTTRRDGVDGIIDDLKFDDQIDIVVAATKKATDSSSLTGWALVILIHQHKSGVCVCVCVEIEICISII